VSPHDIAINRIESELRHIPTSPTPSSMAERACMAAFLSCELSVITTAERDALVKRIRAAEMIRFLELLKVAA
jgi:hypothetical protein